MEVIYQIIDYISLISPIILLIGIFVFISNKNKSITSKYIFILFLCGLIIDILSRFLAKKYNNNLICINLYRIIELIILYQIIKKNSTDFKPFINYILALLIFFNLFEIYEIDFLNHLEYQSYSIAINSIFLLFLCLNQLIKDINSEDTHNQNKLFLFLSLYFILNAFLNLPINFLINYNNYIIFIIWLINIINITILYSYLVYQLWKNGKTQT